jgi:hypothetical protein
LPAMLRSRRIGAMRDIELYRALLGLTAPWTVAGVSEWVDWGCQRSGLGSSLRHASIREDGLSRPKSCCHARG